MHLRSIIVMAVVGLCVAGCGGPHELPTPPTPIPTLIPATLPAGPVSSGAQGAQGAGAAVFNTSCSGCHLLTAETRVGPGLGPLFTLASLPNGKPVSDENLKEWVRKGGGAMPGIPSLTDDQLSQLLAYLKEATGGQTPTAQGTPQGASQAPVPTSQPPATAAAAPEPGAAVFTTNCGACHNLTAEKKVGPGLAKLYGLDRLPNGKAVSDDNLKEYIRVGYGAMPGLSSLTDEQLSQLLPYLREATK